VIPYFVHTNGLPLDESDYKPTSRKDGSIDVVNMRELAKEAEASALKQSTKQEKIMFARIFKFFELSWPARTELKQWMNEGTCRDGFCAESFDNPSLVIATATNEQGQTIAHAAVEPCYMVNSFLNPELLDEKLQSLAGDQIDAALSHRAAQNGISKLLLVVPDFVPHQPDERSVRVIEREVSLPVTSHLRCYTSNRVPYIN